MTADEFKDIAGAVWDAAPRGVTPEELAGAIGARIAQALPTPNYPTRREIAAAVLEVLPRPTYPTAGEIAAAVVAILPAPAPTPVPPSKLPRTFIVTADEPMKFEVRVAADGGLTTAPLPYVPRPKPI
jgi:hypothetical protein